MNEPKPRPHPKTVRRRLLTILYQRYLDNPLDMLTPEDLLEDGSVRRDDLLPNMFYLHDLGLVELLTGYNPPMFAAARIKSEGIDLVENEYEFNLRFPPAIDELEAGAAAIPLLIERLKEEVEFSALDGEERKSCLRDVLYLREEIARPVHRWRRTVIDSVLDWIDAHYSAQELDPPASASRLREQICRTHESP